MWPLPFCTQTADDAKVAGVVHSTFCRHPEGRGSPSRVIGLRFDSFMHMASNDFESVVLFIFHLSSVITSEVLCWWLYGNFLEGVWQTLLPKCCCLQTQLALVVVPYAGKLWAAHASYNEDDAWKIENDWLMYASWGLYLEPLDLEKFYWIVGRWCQLHLHSCQWLVGGKNFGQLKVDSCQLRMVAVKSFQLRMATVGCYKLNSASWKMLLLDGWQMNMPWHLAHVVENSEVKVKSQAVLRCRYPKSSSQGMFFCMYFWLSFKGCFLSATVSIIDYCNCQVLMRPCPFKGCLSLFHSL